MANITADRRGVVRRPVIAKGSVATVEVAKPTRSEYLAFALANKRKPWARRWLREHYMGRFL